jgi:hypothetical protein
VRFGIVRPDFVATLGIARPADVLDKVAEGGHALGMDRVVAGVRAKQPVARKPNQTSMPPSLSSPASSISRSMSGMLTWRLPSRLITPSFFKALIWRLTVSSVRPR